LIVTFSEKRKRKDAHNREKGVKKLRVKVASGKLAKTHITNRGYNKFLTLSGDVSVTLDETKITDDSKWDGLKGYVTNAKLSREKIVEHYGHLWQIEKAFRISKTDLRMRPIFHYRRRRIEAHLAIVFVAYCVWKEIERLLKEASVAMSPKRAAELTHTMYAIDYTLPHARSDKRVILNMDGEQKLLFDVIHKK
ncbi:MAG: transposase, partial [Patescibacteria group bacterium]